MKQREKLKLALETVARPQKLDLSAQVELLLHCCQNNLRLEDELRKEGLSYDSLSYRQWTNDENPPGRSPEYRRLEDYHFPENGIPVVSFFAGAGGLDLGFERAGFGHLASIEINPIFCESLRKNRSSWTVLGPPMHSGDIRNRDEFSHLLRQKLGISAPFEGVFHGGPPCQPFSIAANQRFARSDDNFKRVGFSHEQYGSLLFDFVWYIQQFKPRAFVIENVAGLIDMNVKGEVGLAIGMLQKAGYNVEEPRVLNAANHGVPQKRMRVFICGNRADRSIQLPFEEGLLIPCHSALRNEGVSLENHITREHKAESVLRYMELDFGQRDHLGRVDRLHPQLPSKTVIAGGAKGGGRSHLHPYIPRTLSVRECARLQTFPDDYVFCGPSARQFTQVGNAVPPVLAMKLARCIFEQVYS